MNCYDFHNSYQQTQIVGVRYTIYHREYNEFSYVIVEIRYRLESANTKHWFWIFENTSRLVNKTSKRESPVHGHALFNYKSDRS